MKDTSVILLTPHRDGKLNIALILSIAIHLSIIKVLSRPVDIEELSYEELREITFLDKSYNPKVAKVVKKPPAFISPPEQEDIFNVIKSVLQKETNPSVAEEVERISSKLEEPPLTMSPVEKLDISLKELPTSQAKIKLEDYKPISSGSVGDILHIAKEGTAGGVSTEEILKEKPISLKKHIGQGKSGDVLASIAPVPSQPPISLKTEKAEVSISKTEVIPKKEKPQIDLTELKKERVPSVTLAGPITGRKILKKIIPDYPSFAERKGISGTVVLRFYVDVNGKVEPSVFVEQSSGYLELDKVAINSLKQWIFEPLSQTAQAKKQWGIVTFKFVLL